MLDLLTLVKQIEVASESLTFPAVGITFKPVNQNGSWFISSDCPLRIARLQARSPEDIAQQLLERIGASHGGCWARVAGYLVFYPNFTHEFSLPWLLSIEESQLLRIFVPRKEFHDSVASMVRLSSLAMLQAQLAARMGADVELFVAGTQISAFAQSGDIERIYRELPEIFSSPMSDSCSVAKQILQFFRQNPVARYSVFLAPGDIDPMIFKEGARIIPFDDRAAVKIPARGWFADIDQIPSGFGGNANQRDWGQALMFHLSSQSRGIDIEWETPNFSECKNLAWLMHSVEQRFAKLKLAPVPAQRANVIVALTEECHFLTSFMPLFLERAALYGEATALVSAAAQLTEWCAGVLNRPEVRIGLEKGELELPATLGLVMTTVRRLNKLFFGVD